MAKPTYQLTEMQGQLCLSDQDQSPILHYSGHASELTCIAWPFPDEQKLRDSLYVMRESGEIPDVDTVLLPDGTHFDIEP